MYYLKLKLDTEVVARLFRYSIDTPNSRSDEWASRWRISKVDTYSDHGRRIFHELKLGLMSYYVRGNGNYATTLYALTEDQVELIQ